MDIFNYEFNLSFFRPRKDQYDLCTEWKNTSKNSGQLQELYAKHQENKEKAKELKSGDTTEAKKRKENPHLSVTTFDYQKILIYRKGETSALYYKRKYQTSNITTYDLGKHEGICYVYDENTGKKGGNEVASFVNHYIGTRKEEGVIQHRFYSDNCIPQNKNKIVLTGLLRAAAFYNVEIIHRYLEKGHTQNEGDSVHARIERYTRNDEDLGSSSMVREDTGSQEI